MGLEEEQGLPTKVGVHEVQPGVLNVNTRALARGNIPPSILAVFLISYSTLDIQRLSYSSTSPFPPSVGKPEFRAVLGGPTKALRYKKIKRRAPSRIGVNSIGLDSAKGGSSPRNRRHLNRGEGEPAEQRGTGAAHKNTRGA